MITLNNVTVSYQRHPAIHHISGQFTPATMTAIVGPNGAGKSTLLKAIMGLIRCSSGDISYQCDRLALAYLPQQAAVDRSFPLSVRDVVQQGLWREIGAHKRLNAAQQHRLEQALHHLGLIEHAARPIADLSVGQFQRTLFARLMLQQAQVMLLDEPFAALDTRTTLDLLDVIQQWQQQGRTVIAVLHDLQQVRQYFAETLLIAREKIAWGDTATALLDSHLQRARVVAERWQETAPLCQTDLLSHEQA